MKALKCRTMNPVYNYEKSEVYSLGLTVLECCNLKYPDVYEMGAIDKERLE